MASISEGEVAVYDRQLRLWGVQAQQRLLKSKVLVWGLEGANVEVCKNLVLAGVALTICDGGSVTAADVAFNYFLRTEDMGKNRAESAACRVQEMNPLCSVSSMVSATVEAVTGYDLVSVTLGALGWDVEKARSIDATCRKSNVGFILTITAGELAFFFSNLHEHVVEERSSQQGAPTVDSSKQQPKAAAVAEPEKLSYPSLDEWLTCTPTILQQQKTDDSFIFFSLMVDFLRTDKSHCSPDAAPKFEEYCSNVAKCTPAIDGVDSVQDAFRFVFMEPLIHVASIIGGLIAQEVIKAITKRDPPLLNTVCFNAHMSIAWVERIPAMSAPRKRKMESIAEVTDLID